MPAYESAHATEVTCEVCGTSQTPVTECVECGMRLNLPSGVEPVGDPPIEYLADFEPTLLESVGELNTEVVPDMEATILPATGPAREEILRDMEPTATESFELFDVQTESVPDLERTAEPFEKSAPAPNGDRCMYCGSEQSGGRVCDNCGMARSKVLAPAPVAARPVLRDDELPVVRCRSCASNVVQRLLCSECGHPLPPIES